MSPTRTKFGGPVFQNFLGHSPEWYKFTIIGFLIANPLLLAIAGPTVACWRSRR